MYQLKNIALVFFLLLFFSCKKTTQQEQTGAPVFKLLEAEQTGIDFSNDLTVNLDFNIFKYMYYYNGAGVGVGDFNNDGLLDVFFTGNRVPNKFYLNKGGLKFQDNTEGAGFQNTNDWSNGVAVVDINQDGFVDIYVNVSGSEKFGNLANLLYINNHDGTFTDHAAECGVKVVGYVKAVASGDYDNDGRPDLYISQRGGGYNPLLRNEGPRDPANPQAGWKFANVTKAAGLAEPISSFPCWFFDYDNDGWQDIFVCGYAGGIDAVVQDYLGQPSKGHRPRLYHNNGNGTFTDVAAQMGFNQTILGMSGNFGDLDNDGFLDFYLGTGEPFYTALVPNRMFRNAGGKKFQDVTTSGGFGNVQKGHAIAFADLNNDGQQDIYAVLGGAYTGDKYYTALYANPGHKNHWVKLKLEGVDSNRSALGARIRVIIDTPEGERSLYRTVSTGGSFGAGPLRNHVGLGDAKSIKAIEIFWPTTGRTQQIPSVPMEHFYKVREGDSIAVPWKVNTFKFLRQS